MSFVYNINENKNSRDNFMTVLRCATQVFFSPFLSWNFSFFQIMSSTTKELKKTSPQAGTRYCLMRLGFNPEVMRCLWCTPSRFFVSEASFFEHCVSEHEEPIPQHTRLMMQIKKCDNSCSSDCQWQDKMDNKDKQKKHDSLKDMTDFSRVWQQHPVL